MNGRRNREAHTECSHLFHWGEQPAMGHQQPAMGHWQQAKSKKQKSTSNKLLATGNKPPATRSSSPSLPAPNQQKKKRRLPLSGVAVCSSMSWCHSPLILRPQRVRRVWDRSQRWDRCWSFSQYLRFARSHDVAMRRAASTDRCPSRPVFPGPGFHPLSRWHCLEQLGRFLQFRRYNVEDLYRKTQR